MVIQQLVNAAVNVVLLAALPFGIYAWVQKRRQGQTLAKSAVRAGTAQPRPKAAFRRLS